MLGRSVPRIVLLAAMIVAGYLIFTTVVTALKSHGLAQDEQTVQRDIADLERQRDELSSIREYLSSDEYIEGVARRILGLVKPGETRVLVNPPENTQQPAQQPTPAAGTWWESLFGR